MTTHPLAGKRVVITRPDEQSEGFLMLLRDVGAVPISFPTIAIAPIADTAPLKRALVAQPDWIIFTSANGVRAVSAILDSSEMTRFKRFRIAVIGPATAAALIDCGLSVDLQPAEYIAEAIVEALLAQGSIAGKKFLLLRADIARATLREQLIAQGGQVEELAVYRTIGGTPTPDAYAEVRRGVDVITFTSSSTVRYFFELLGPVAYSIAAHARIACIGPITAATVRDLGLPVDLIAYEYTIPGLIAALSE